ncbi:MAG: polyprenyl diphosphate synthase [Bacteroidales bacterium]|nr:polyprenyl diphosphate synthase [Bacteroidales bacterium]
MNGIPRHIGIIMDGNGRWAVERNQPRSFGHIHGADAVDEVLRGCLEKGVEYLTLYAFSTENNKRPEEEVTGLMNLAINTVDENIDRLMGNGIRIAVIGNLNALRPDVVEKYKWCMKKTEKNVNLTVVLALNYSFRDEIVRAVKDIVAERENGKTEIIDEKYISNHLDTKNYPDPDLIIRTGGEYRLSNFLLWQASYAELLFCKTLWPDFKKEDLFSAIEEYSHRKRRFGLIDNNK